MTISVLTGFTPTPENRGGISALLYALLFFRPQTVKINIFSFNLNAIDAETVKEIEINLRANIHIFSIPKSYLYSKKNKWLIRLNKFLGNSDICRLLFTKDVIKTLSLQGCDFFLVYPYYMGGIINKLPLNSFVVSGPDSETLNRSRRLSNPYRLNSRKMRVDDFIFLNKYMSTERIWDGNNVRVHFVGMADYQFYRDVTGNDNAHFLLHPFVKYKEKIIDFTSKEKLKVIIPGSYDMYYNVDVDKMLPQLIDHKDVLLKHFEFTFLGKRWSPIDKRLKDAGFECEFKTWVDDYAEELVQHDIQITPISFGTGTKGKVLDAMVNGLLVIGSDYALENICVRDMESCVRYRDASHIASILISVANHRERYQTIAEKGRSQVMKYHDPTRISKRFFEIYYRELTGKKLESDN